MNWTGIILALIALSAIPFTFFLIRHLDRLDTTRGDQVEEWIRGYLNGSTSEET